MKKILTFIFLLCSLSAFSQANNIFSAGLCHTNGAPNFNPGARGCRVALDTVSQNFYLWKIGTTWVSLGSVIDVTLGCVPPAYVPTKWQSDVAVNGCDSLYRYRAGAWRHLNPGGGGGGTWGSITGTLSDQTDLQAALDTKLETVDLWYLDNGGNDVDITSSAGQSVKLRSFGGIDIYDDGDDAIAIDGGGIAPSKWTDAGAYTYLTASGDNVGVGMTAAPTGRFTARGAGTTSATNAITAEKSDGTRIMTVRNDGRVGIGTSTPGSTLEVVNASAGQLRLTNTSGTKFTNMMTDASGHLFFENTGGSYLWGAGAPEAGELFSLGQTFSGTGAHYGLNTQFTFDPAADVSAGLYGHQFRARYIGTRLMQNCNTFFSRTTITNSGNGNYIAFRGYSELSGSGNANILTGASFELDHSSSGTIAMFKGFESNVAANTGTITNTYGYYCGDITTGTQTNQPYSIYCSDANARSYFAGKFIHDATNTAAGTTGNQTINKPSGTVNIAAGGTTVTVTNSLVTTSSIIIPVIRTNDATAQILNVVPAAGSFTINITASTGEVSIGFVCYN